MARITCCGIIGQFYFDDDVESITVKGDSYRAMVTDYLHTNWDGIDVVANRRCHPHKKINKQTNKEKL